MDTQNYKRTLAGSVGAGMGALMNASGRTYFILEHKTASKYHQMGESQKIIVDQIELGRDASCQVRYDESFETVSRKHAAIVRDGENWKLVHLSQSNPTLVNGRPINGSYYLQTGDEIQLSVGGPRLGFIVPQGRQALTSSIGLTERMSLFRKQALRPYKRALIGMGIVFVLAVAGLVAWNYQLGVKNEHLSGELEVQALQLRNYQGQLDSLGAERDILERQQHDIENKLRNSEGNSEALKAQLENVRGQLESVNSRSHQLNSEVRTLKEQLAEQNVDVENYLPVSAGKNVQQTTAAAVEDDIQQGNASADLRDYYDYIYTIKVDRIEIEKDGISFNPGIPVSEIICGTGFVLENGMFVTDRQNVEPWVFVNTEWKEPWRRILAEYAGGGCNVIIHYRAYSNKGTGKPLTFVNTDFMINRSYDITETRIEVSKGVRAELKKHGIKLQYVERNTVSLHTYAPGSSSFAYIRNKGSYGEGLPYDVESSETMEGGAEVHMVGYAGNAGIHNPVPAHFNDRVNVDDTRNGMIILQNQVAEQGYYGSPAFKKESDGTYRVIGLTVGSVFGKDRLVPVSRFVSR